MKWSYVAVAVGVMVLWTALAVVAAGAIFSAKDKATAVAEAQAQTRAILIRSCQDNGNPLRLAVQQMLRTQIHQSHSPAVERRFPHALIRRANRRSHQLIRQIAPVDCASLYH